MVLHLFDSGLSGLGYTYLLSYSGSLPICPVKTEICVIFQKCGISRVLKLFGRTSKMAKVEINTTLELPVIRLGQINANVQIEYSFYRSDNILLTSKSLDGHGQKRLELTKQNYAIAFQEAVKDLMLKSKEVFISVLR